jgi:hypothetical protein
MGEAQTGLVGVPEPSVGGDHFRDSQAGAKFTAQLAKRQVSNTGHWRQDCRRRDTVASDFEQACVSFSGFLQSISTCASRCEPVEAGDRIKSPFGWSWKKGIIIPSLVLMKKHTVVISAGFLTLFGLWRYLLTLVLPLVPL